MFDGVVLDLDFLLVGDFLLADFVEDFVDLEGVAEDCSFEVFGCFIDFEVVGDGEGVFVVFAFVEVDFEAEFAQFFDFLAHAWADEVAKSDESDKD